MASPHAQPATLIEPPLPVSEPGIERLPLVRHRRATAVAAASCGIAAFVSYPAGAKAVMAAGLAIVLVIVSVTDLERRIIPNRIVLPAIAALLAGRIAFFPSRTSEYVLASLAVAFLLLLPNFLNSSAIGMGDVKLAALLGAGLGWPAFDAVALGFILLAPLAVATLVRGGMAARKHALPLGPFLACGGVLVLIIPQLLGLKGG